MREIPEDVQKLSAGIKSGQPFPLHQMKDKGQDMNSKLRALEKAIVNAAAQWYDATHQPNIDPWTPVDKCDCPSCMKYASLIDACARLAAARKVKAKT